jgi:hypothetical protein
MAGFFCHARAGRNHHGTQSCKTGRSRIIPRVIQLHELDWSIINRPSRVTITTPVPSGNFVPIGLYPGENPDRFPHRSRPTFKIKVIMDQRHGYPFCREVVQAPVRCSATALMKKTTTGIGKWKRWRRSKRTPVALLPSIFHGIALRYTTIFLWDITVFGMEIKYSGKYYYQPGITGIEQVK